MNTQATSNLDDLDDIDALLDRNLDDIADLPTYETFKPGVHRATIKWARKDIELTVDGKKVKTPHMTLELTLVETMEHTDKKDDDNPGKPGDKCSTAYNLTNENAMGALKKATASLGAHLGQSSLKEIIKGSDGFEVAAVTKARADKSDKTKFYLQVEDMIPV